MSEKEPGQGAHRPARIRDGRKEYLDYRKRYGLGGRFTPPSISPGGDHVPGYIPWYPQEPQDEDQQAS